MTYLFLHEVPYHLHRGIGALQVVSWVAIALGGAALLVSWGRIIAWLREDETLPPPRLASWGEDDGGWYAELRNASLGQAWRAELPDGRVIEPKVTRSGRSTWVRTGPVGPPVRLLSDDGEKLDVPGGG